MAARYLRSVRQLGGCVNNDCFVIMPYGNKKSVASKRIVDFDNVYEGMIFPAVEELGLRCIRCDRIDEPGSIHKRMMTQIFEARVAIVDTSTLNANVFYELGVRHALKRSGTVLIQEEGTSSPFNIAGLATIAYAATKAGMARAVPTIQSYIKNAMGNPNATDSLVYEALPLLQVRRDQKAIPKFTVTHYRVNEPAGAASERRRIGFVTGDRRDIDIGQIWVNSENTNMQMDTFYGRSTSATIRYLGAERDAIGAVAKDTIGDALRAQMNGRVVVDPATVIPTTAGTLEQTNNVKWIFHVASVIGQPLVGYKPVQQIDQCVKAALRLASEPKFADQQLRSILFPVFGTGPAGADVETTIRVCLDAAVDYLERRRERGGGLSDIYFYVWGEVDFEVCNAVASRMPSLSLERKKSAVK
jgi:O-acetyl-ADP-ribose deacetylase (regulator of RNase III)